MNNNCLLLETLINHSFRIYVPSCYKSSAISLVPLNCKRLPAPGILLLSLTHTHTQMMAELSNLLPLANGSFDYSTLPCVYLHDQQTGRAKRLAAFFLRLKDGTTHDHVVCVQQRTKLHQLTLLLLPDAPANDSYSIIQAPPRNGTVLWFLQILCRELRVRCHLPAHSYAPTLGATPTGTAGIATRCSRYRSLTPLHSGMDQARDRINQWTRFAVVLVESSVVHYADRRTSADATTALGAVRNRSTECLGTHSFWLRLVLGLSELGNFPKHDRRSGGNWSAGRELLRRQCR